MEEDIFEKALRLLYERSLDQMGMTAEITIERVPRDEE